MENPLFHASRNHDILGVRFQVDLGNSELTVQKIALSERLLSRPTAGNFGWEEPFSVSEVSKRQRIDVRLSAATVLG